MIFETIATLVLIWSNIIELPQYRIIASNFTETEIKIVTKTFNSVELNYSTEFFNYSINGDILNTFEISNEEVKCSLISGGNIYYATPNNIRSVTSDEAIIWDISITTSCSDIVERDGYLYIASSTRRIIKIDQQTGVVIFSTGWGNVSPLDHPIKISVDDNFLYAISQEGFAAKYDLINGAQLWKKRYFTPGTFYSNILHSIGTSDGYIFLHAWSRDNTYPYLIKIDDDGLIQWSKNGFWTTVPNLIISDDDIIIIGSSDPLSTSGSNTVINKINSNGEIILSKPIDNLPQGISYQGNILSMIVNDKIIYSNNYVNNSDGSSIGYISSFYTNDLVNVNDRISKNGFD